VNRVLMALVVMAGGLLSGCTEETQQRVAAELAGTHDLTLVGDRIFVTSTDRNELRVLRLAEQENDRDFIRAPNPLKALAIPVLPRPQALARDVRYVDDVELTEPYAYGSEVAGPYVYARSNGSTKISVVATGDEYLRELARVDTSALGVSTGPVTAFSARGPDAEGGSSTLYYATQEPDGARLWRLRVPAPEALSGGTPMPTPEALDAPLPEGESVSSLLVLPEAGQIAVSTRGAAGRSGSSFKLDEQTLVTMPLNFGAPVLQLSSHGMVKRVEKDEEGNLVVTAETRRIFAILDPAFCGGQPQCTGVLAVDPSTGAVALDSTGHPMAAIGAGPGLPMGMTLASQSDLLLQRGTALDVVTIPLLGIVPLSSGEILFFDALTLRPFDIRTEVADSSVGLFTAQGVSKDKSADVLAGFITVAVTDGVTRSAQYSLVFQGLLPGLDSVVRQPGTSGRFEVPAAPQGLALQEVVHPEDLIILFPEGGGDTCATELVVSAVEPPATSGQPAVLVTNTQIPEACASFTRFQVRAAGAQPLVLLSTAGSFLRRMGAGDTYEERGAYYFHPDGYDGSLEGVGVGIYVSRSDTELTRGDFYVVTANSRFFPFSITVDNTYEMGFSRYRLPGSVVHADLGGTDLAYISYPSADGILQINLEAIFAEVPNSRAITPFE